MPSFSYEVWKKPSSNPHSNAWRHRISIDGQVISSGYCIDMVQLVESFCGSSDYFILTCSCGEPGCADLFIPFHVEHLEGGIIRWHIEAPEPEREFFFSAGQAVHTLLCGLKKLEEHGALPVPELIKHLDQIKQRSQTTR